MSNKPLLIPDEHTEQRMFVHWWRHEYPRVWIYAVPNGGKRPPKTAKKLKAEGVVPGVPDLHVPAWNLWIEMKRQKGGTLSKEQRDWRDYLLSIGDSFILGKGCEDAKAQVLEFARGRSA